MAIERWIFTHGKVTMRPIGSYHYVTGGRGYGKAHAQREAMRKWRSTHTLRMPHTTPPIGEIIWLCRRPTEPEYPPGSYGWYMNQMEARISPELRKHYRRIADRDAAIMDRFAEMLGVKVDDTDGS